MLKGGDSGTNIDPDGPCADRGGALGPEYELQEGTEIVEGQVRDTNLDTYTASIRRLADAPELDMQFVESVEAPVGCRAALKRPLLHSRCKRRGKGETNLLKLLEVRISSGRRS
jgi:hypothetical protein